MPEFSGAAMVELVLPLAITVLAAQNAQGFAVLEAAGHKPPVNMITAACGIGSVIAASVGTVSTCLTGPVNAIIASSGDRDKHYAAGVMVALLALLFGIFSPLFTRFMLATPKAFIAALAGLALVRMHGTHLRRLLQGRLHPRRHGHFSRHGGQCPDPVDRRPVLGPGHRLCRILGA